MVVGVPAAVREGLLSVPAYGCWYGTLSGGCFYRWRFAEGTGGPAGVDGQIVSGSRLSTVRFGPDGQPVGPDAEELPAAVARSVLGWMLRCFMTDDED